MQPKPWSQDAGLTRTSNHGSWGPQDNNKYFSSLKPPTRSVGPTLPKNHCKAS
ncbi:hypothetical protein PCASD_25180 [Puccinia coronata f. sp. avenae]|uniref:Uncharacterized protein n=1 Tax=Puccinia coronata f. sp. avenae TaxID=200324 RepID=A0A2N5TP80_9BASI|nr:hypothetical protein PCASD_25180 [Puccinia coronata f. sp. avenae]